MRRQVDAALLAPFRGTTTSDELLAAARSSSIAARVPESSETLEAALIDEVASNISRLYPQLQAMSQSLASVVVLRAFPKGIRDHDSWQGATGMLAAARSGDRSALRQMAQGFAYAAAVLPGSKCSKAMHSFNVAIEVPDSFKTVLASRFGTDGCSITTFLVRYQHLLSSGGDFKAALNVTGGDAVIPAIVSDIMAVMGTNFL